MNRLSISDSISRGQKQAARNIAAIADSKTAGKFYQVAAEEVSDLHDRGVVAGLLNNFQQIMDSAQGVDFTKSSDFGPYVMEVWPIVTAWYPDFPLKDLISVQEMDQPLAYLFFSLLKTGTTKSDTLIGEAVETPLGMRSIRGKYPTGEIVGERVLKNQIDSNDGTILAYAPLNVATIPGYIEKTKVIVGANTYVGYTVDDGYLLFKLNGTAQAKSAINIEVATGILAGSVITALADSSSSDLAFRVNYVWDLNYAETDNIMRVKEEVEMRPVEATPRALELEWTLFSEYLKKTQFGQDIRTDNTKRVLDLLYQYQVRYILDELYDGATGTYTSGGSPVTETTINLTISNNYSLEVQYANVVKQLKALGNKVELASGRQEGNRIVVGQDFKAWCESLPSNMFKPAGNEGAAFSGPRELGELSTFKIYYDPYREADEGFMTYRGKMWYDAAYYLGEYMPIVPTDAIALGVKVRSSFCSMEGYRYDKPSCVFKLKFV